MEEQNYSNHKRYYIPHHFVFYASVLVLTGLGVYQAIADERLRWVWLFLSALTMMVAWLSFMLRQHYAMTVQDRVILQEMRYRYFVLTGERFEPIEEQLSKGQIFALRFAPDEELLPLIQRALDEKLGGDAIKQAITNWKADRMRV